MALEQPKRKALLDVMRSMFSTLEDFRTFLKDSLGRNTDDYAVGALPTVRSRVIDRADEQEWLRELIEALKEAGGEDARAHLDAIDVTGHFSKPRIAAFRKAVPDLSQRLGLAGDAELDAALAARLVEIAKDVRGEGSVTPELRRALEQLGLLAETPSGPALEKIVRESNSLLDIHNWIARLTEIEACVCRIAFETGSGLSPRGTGFLVAPDVVLTNHHVIAPVLDGEFNRTRVRAQFDYHVLRNGSIDAGTIVDLVDHEQKWLIAAAPHDPLDVTVHALDEEPKPKNLDYALLRLSRKVGAKPIGSAKGKNRGWLDLTKDIAPNAAVDAPIFIVQHPEGAAMKLALETKSVIGTSPKNRRIRYRTNTLSGSSGSPVFNQDWELLALHHAGDPKYPTLRTGKYNEGIPIRTLVKHLEDEQILAKL